MRIIHMLAAAATVMGFAGSSGAHPKLVSSSPAANTTVVSPSHIDLRFSEQLMPNFSKGDLVTTTKFGGGAMKINSNASVRADGKTLVITPNARLQKGKYFVSWRVVSKDTHKLAGRYGFAVK